MFNQDTNIQVLDRHCSVCNAAELSLGTQQQEPRHQEDATPDSLSTLPIFTAENNPHLHPTTLLDPWAEPLEQTDPSSGNGLPQREISSQNHSVAGSVREVEKEGQPRWWLVHTKPRQEKKLAGQLQRLDISHFLPVTKCKAVTRGRTRMSRLPQFPGYLFLWADRTQRLTALETNRIVATYPVPCDESLGQQLWELADLIEKGVSLRIEERLAAGQSVRVKSGLLKDKRGQIIKRGGKTRLFVFVSELLGGVSLEIEQHLLEPY